MDPEAAVPETLGGVVDGAAGDGPGEDAPEPGLAAVGEAWAARALRRSWRKESRTKARRAAGDIPLSPDEAEPGGWAPAGKAKDMIARAMAGRPNRIATFMRSPAVLLPGS